eukprot:360794-Chlamydomonas_euryale.AAC.1
MPLVCAWGTVHVCTGGLGCTGVERPCMHEDDARWHTRMPLYAMYVPARVHARLCGQCIHVHVLRQAMRRCAPVRAQPPRPAKLRTSAVVHI